MARNLYKPRPRPRLSEPFRHTVPRPSKHSHARRSLPPQQPGPPGASMWGGVAPKGGPAVLVPDSDSDEPLETGGTGRGSDSDDAWGSESDWSESPGYAGAAAGVSPVGAGEPSLASAHAMAAAQSFKHMSLFAASGLDDDEFDVRTASALDESKDLLRFVAEAAPVAFTEYRTTGPRCASSKPRRTRASRRSRATRTSSSVPGRSTPRRRSRSCSSCSQGCGTARRPTALRRSTPCAASARRPRRPSPQQPRGTTPRTPSCTGTCRHCMVSTRRRAAARRARARAGRGRRRLVGR
ncbi:hypothetical protein DMC30DRAFT_282947 [Rhodotorula diobovata]|uniref:Uncharacterized protein n=1 Tax=Rhodotorula diobovata TaxID=5288 RepID=A0A5C5FUL9_9BASI|nr:hypothetical protein DMC30DRAFT_282947 [Rhodotorula diobovata]